jgi:hypothetical protein
MNVKKGDLAIMIEANPEFSDCIGRIVRVGQPAMKVGWWVIYFVGATPSSVKHWPGDLSTSDASLRPVSGLDDPEQIDTEQPINDEVTA